MNFDEAFKQLIGHEGKFQNHYRDRGNWTTGRVGHGTNRGTKYGITAMSYPDVDIENLSIEDAKVIYRRDFWERLELDSLPDILAFQMFDTAVNSGVGNASRMLQRAVGVLDDGWIGTITLTAVAGFRPEILLARFNGERLRFMTNLSTWSSFGKGWARRIAHNLLIVK